MENWKRKTEDEESEGPSFSQAHSWQSSPSARRRPSCTCAGPSRGPPAASATMASSTRVPSPAPCASASFSSRRPCTRPASGRTGRSLPHHRCRLRCSLLSGSSRWAAAGVRERPRSAVPPGKIRWRLSHLIFMNKNSMQNSRLITRTKVTVMDIHESVCRMQILYTEVTIDFKL